MTDTTNQSKSYKEFQINIKDYKIVKQLQSGGFGLVYSVQNIKTEKIYAAKVLNMHCDEFQYQKMIDREIGILIRCQHPTIIRVIGYSKIDFINQNNVTIFMDLANKGSLADVLQKAQKGLLEDIFDNTKRQIILIGIARGMMFLHQHDIIHRDLKPGNILLDNNYHPLITDFGLSKCNDSNNPISQSQQCGTSMYMAPEIIEGNKYNSKIDVYSFGILMYEVVTNSIPYPLFMSGKMTAYLFNKKVVDEDYRPKFNFQINKSIQKLIESCWAKDPNKRPTFENIFKKLAYNIDDSENEKESNNYYLEGIDVSEVMSYVNDIDGPGELVDDGQKVESFNELYEKLIKPLLKENDELKNQISKIQKERELETNSFLSEIQSLTDKIEQEKEKHAIEMDKMKKECNEKLANLNETNDKKIQNMIKIFSSEIRQDLQKDKETEIIKVFKENSTFETFNNLKGEFQVKVILEVLKENKQNEIVQKNGRLLNFLSNEQIKTNYQFDKVSYIYMQANDQKVNCFQNIDEIEKVFISPESIEMLLENNSIDSSIFLDAINSFDDIYIQLNYPFNEYKDVFNGLINIKKSNQFTLKINVSFTDIDEHDKSFQYNECINSIEINPPIKTIPKDFFKGCSLTEITFPESVTLICCNAFKGCANLKITKIPSSIKTIEEGVFADCTSIDVIEIPPSVEYIGEFGFAGCINLSEIMINPYKTKIEMNTFDQCIFLDHLIFDTSVKAIEKFDFDKFWILTKITIPKSVNLINFGSFSNCSSLKEIVIPESVRSIGDNTFNNCSALTEIIIPSSVVSIGKNSFNNCTSLERIIIPESVKSVGDNLFNNCSFLTQITIPPLIKELCNNSFTQYISPYNTEKMFNDGTLFSSNFIEIIKPISNLIIEIKYPSENFDKIYQIVKKLKQSNKSKIKICIFISGIEALSDKLSNNKDIDLVKLDSGIKRISVEGKGSFAYCSSLAQITISSSLSLIGENSFYDCTSLTKIEIPSSVTSIGKCSFYGCISLTEIIIPSSVTEIGDNAFDS